MAGKKNISLVHPEESLMAEKIKETLSTKAVRTRLVAEFQVRFMVLFGSTAAGVRKRGSDVDLAVYFRRALSEREEERLVSFLRQHLATDRLDLVSLNDVSCALRYEVTQDGILVFEEQEGDYSNYSTRTFKQYEEMNFLNRHYHQSMIEELQEYANAQS